MSSKQDLEQMAKSAVSNIKEFMDNPGPDFTLLRRAAAALDNEEIRRRFIESRGIIMGDNGILTSSLEKREKSNNLESEDESGPGYNDEEFSSDLKIVVRDNKLVINIPDIKVITTNYSNYQSLSCKLCPWRAFAGFHPVNSHVLTRHFGVKKIKCTVCNNCFVDKNLHNKHFEVHRNTDYFCQLPKCRFVTPSLRMIAKHIRKHRDSSFGYRKIEAVETTANSEDFIQENNQDHYEDASNCSHELIVRNQNLICPICYFRTDIFQVLKRHILRHIGETGFKCPTCNFPFRDSELLEIHKTARLKCHLCCQRFRNPQSLSSHLNRHENNERFFYCSTLNAYFDSELAPRHLKRHKICSIRLQAPFAFNEDDLSSIEDFINRVEFVRESYHVKDELICLYDDSKKPGTFGLVLNIPTSAIVESNCDKGLDVASVQECTQHYEIIACGVEEFDSW